MSYMEGFVVCFESSGNNERIQMNKRSFVLLIENLFVCNKSKLLSWECLEGKRLINLIKLRENGKASRLAPLKSLLVNDFAEKR